MKNKIIALFLSLFFFTAFSQDLRYGVRAAYNRAVKDAALKSPRLISEVIEGYPVNWITSYTSVEITATSHGKTTKALSANAVLSPEQKNMLSSADLGTELVIDVKYKYKDPFSGVVENNKIHVSMTVVPETEAEYEGGYQEMIGFLEKNSINKISDAAAKKLQRLVVRFTVNEEGKIADAKIFNTSNDPKMDRLFLDTINNMPAWKPAVNSQGLKVKQEFEFAINSPGAGGC